MVSPTWGHPLTQLTQKGPTLTKLRRRKNTDSKKVNYTNNNNTTATVAPRASLILKSHRSARPRLHHGRKGHVAPGREGTSPDQSPCFPGAHTHTQVEKSSWSIRGAGNAARHTVDGSPPRSRGGNHGLRLNATIHACLVSGIWCALQIPSSSTW